MLTITRSGAFLAAVLFSTISIPSFAGVSQEDLDLTLQNGWSIMGELYACAYVHQDTKKRYIDPVVRLSMAQEAYLDATDFSVRNYEEAQEAKTHARAEVILMLLESTDPGIQKRSEKICPNALARAESRTRWLKRETQKLRNQNG